MSAPNLNLHDGLVTRRIIEAFVNLLVNNNELRGLVTDVEGNVLSKETFKTECFDIKLDVQLTRDKLSLYPLIQIFKYLSGRHATNRFIRNIFVAVQTNSKDGESALILGEKIEDIVNELELKLNDTLVSLFPVEFIKGASAPSNVTGVHSYQSVFRLAVRKKK